MRVAIAIVCGLVLIGFIVFAFRQGLKVTPDSSGNGPNSNNIQ
ncbi:cbb3-type cytochrome oxidase subunit 3 [Bradyrhizobium yuanmingense]